MHSGAAPTFFRDRGGHAIHVTLIAGIIVSAVADELVVHHPAHHVDLAAACVLVGGPLIYLLGNAVYKKVV